MYYVYLLRCADDTLYTGITTDVTRRFEEHKNAKKNNKGARYTRAHGAVEMCYVEEAKDRSHASQREAAIRGLSRAEKLALSSQSGRGSRVLQ